MCVCEQVNIDIILTDTVCLHQDLIPSDGSVPTMALYGLLVPTIPGDTVDCNLTCVQTDSESTSQLIVLIMLTCSHGHCTDVISMSCSITCIASCHVYSNKESDPEKYALKLKLHRGGVRSCQYAQDGTSVISCSSEGEVKVHKLCLLALLMSKFG